VHEKHTLKIGEKMSKTKIVEKSNQIIISKKNGTKKSGFITVTSIYTWHTPEDRGELKIYLKAIEGLNPGW
jgi:hypothetical protein